MIRCPKCSSVAIRGPSYVSRDYYGSPHLDTEALLYTCKRCGYHETKPCDDAKPIHKLLSAYGGIGKPETTDGDS